MGYISHFVLTDPRFFPNDLNKDAWNHKDHEPGNDWTYEHLCAQTKAVSERSGQFITHKLVLASIFSATLYFVQIVDSEIKVIMQQWREISGTWAVSRNAQEAMHTHIHAQTKPDLKPHTQNTTSYLIHPDGDDGSGWPLPTSTQQK